MNLKMEEKSQSHKEIFNPKVRDNRYWSEIERIIEDSKLDMRFISGNFNSFVMRRDSAVYLAYYEIFKQVKDLPGCFGEFGVYWGSELFTWLNFMELFLPLDRGRKLFGFDDFNGYERNLDNCEKNSVDFIHDLRGGFGVPSEAIERLVKIKNSDNILPDHERVKLYNGEIRKTWEEFKQDNPGVRFCLACVDFNLYDPTSFILSELCNLLVKGGIIVFRGYGIKPWEGESRAVDKFLETKGKNFSMHNIDFSYLPAAYIVKKF